MQHATGLYLNMIIERENADHEILIESRISLPTLSFAGIKVAKCFNINNLLIIKK